MAIFIEIRSTKRAKCTCFRLRIPERCFERANCRSFIFLLCILWPFRSTLTCLWVINLSTLTVLMSASGSRTIPLVLIRTNSTISTFRHPKRGFLRALMTWKIIAIPNWQAWRTRTNIVWTHIHLTDRCLKTKCLTIRATGIRITLFGQVVEQHLHWALLASPWFEVEHRLTRADFTFVLV